MHFAPNQISHAKNGKLTIGVEDQLPIVVFFFLIVEWYTPYELVYGLMSLLPIKFIIPTN